MKHLRAWYRLAALVLISVVYYLRLKLGPRGGAARRTRIFHLWSGGLARAMGMRVEVRGRRPEPPFFLVSNHLGYIDVILLASQLHCVFVSKADVADWPVIGHLCRSVDTLFIRRESKRDIPRVMADIEATMAGGRGVVIFPEGTSSPGNEVLPFRPSLLEAAARSGIPVSYAAIGYRVGSGNIPASTAVCWWDDTPFGGHLYRLLTLERFEATLEFGAEPIRQPDRKVLASQLWDGVQALFRPLS